MTVPLNVNGITYNYPETGDVNWGPNSTAWASAVTVGMLQKAGGAFTLTADVNFGATYGPVSVYYKSRAATPSATGVLRLGNSEGVGWKNSGGSGDYLLKPDADGFLQYNSIDLVNLSGSQTLTNKTLTSPVIITPNLGVATCTSLNGLTITTTTSGTLTIANSSSLITSGAFPITLTSTASTVVTLPTSGTLYGTLSGSITSLQLKTSLSDETGSGAAVFADTPTLVTPVLGVATATSINKVDLTAPASAATLTIANNASLITVGAFAVTLTATNTTGITLPLTGTLATLAGSEVFTNKTLSGNTAATLISGSGTLTLNTTGTITVPNATDTLMGKATSDSMTNKTFDAEGTGNSLSNVKDSNIKAAAAIALNKLAATTVSRALVSDGSGFVSAATTTATEIGYVNLVTSSIQTQLDARVFKTTYSAKGSILAATAASTPADLPVGTNGYVLTADSSTSTGLKYTPIIAARGYRNATQTGVNTNASAVKINFDTTSGGVNFDTNSGFNTSTSVYTVATAGKYYIQSKILVIGTNVLATLYQLRLSIGGVDTLHFDEKTAIIATRFSLGGSCVINLAAAATLEFYFFGNGDNSINTLSISGGSGDSYFSISSQGFI